MQSKLTQRTVKTLTAQDKPYEVVDTELKGFILRVQPSGIMTYYYSYRNADGKRQRYRIGRVGTITVTQAREYAQQCAAKVVGGEDIHLAKKEKRRAYQEQQQNTLGQFIEHRYKPWVMVERKSGNETLECINRNFKQWYGLPLSSLTVSQLEQWCSTERKRGKKNSTLNRDICALRSMLSKAVDWEVISKHPLKKWKQLKIDQQAKVRYLTNEEETRLRNALHTRDEALKEQRRNGNQWRAERQYSLMLDLTPYCFADYLTPMVLLSMNTGMRRGELFNLHWQDVNFERQLLTIVGYNAKSGKTRHIALNQEAIAVLTHWRELIQTLQPNSNLVFPNQDNKPFDNVNKAWASLLHAANIQEFRWHDMRHHFASKLVMKGVDLNTVRELLGHSDLTMTLRYAHLAPEHKAKAVALLLDEHSTAYTALV